MKGRKARMAKSKRQSRTLSADKSCQLFRNNDRSNVEENAASNLTLNRCRIWAHRTKAVATHRDMFTIDYRNRRVILGSTSERVARAGAWEKAMAGGWLQKLFGGQPEKSPRTPQRKPAIGSRGAMDPVFREVIEILEQEPKPYTRTLTKSVLLPKVLLGDYGEARRILQSIVLPQVNEDTYQRIMNAGGGESWAGFEDVKAAALVHPTAALPLDTLYLGEFPAHTQAQPELRFAGEGHLLTIAPTGAGKGQRYILPNTFKYRGPILCIDPKGENYRTNAWRRDIHGHVFKFAPFEDDTDCFNPLDFVESWEDARILGDLLLIPSGKGEPFWDLSAQSLVRGLVMFVKRTRLPELQNLREVCRLLSPSTGERDAMLDEMRLLDDERFVELANEIDDMTDNVRKSVYATANSHMTPWRDERIAAATSSTTEDWDPGYIYSRIYIEEYGAECGMGDVGPRLENDTIIRGMADSIFLILPPTELPSYGAVLRVILGVHLMKIQREVASLLNDPENTFRPARSVLFILDELPQLGYMGILENAVAIARSGGVKLWFFAQDLAQLQQIYPKWESIVSNCKVQIFFKPGDLGTAEYLSRRLGMRKDILGGQSPLASPQQLMGAAFNDNVVILKSGAKPIKARQPEHFFEDEDFQEIIRREKVGSMAKPRREMRGEESPAED